MEPNAGIPPAHCLALRLVVASGALLNELELLLQDHRLGRNLRYYLQYPHKVVGRRAGLSCQLHQMAFCKCCTSGRIIQVVQPCLCRSVEHRYVVPNVPGKLSLCNVCGSCFLWLSFKLIQEFPNQLVTNKQCRFTPCCYALASRMPHLTVSAHTMLQRACHHDATCLPTPLGSGLKLITP